MIKGIVRDLDPLGRATLPIEMRRSLGMVAGEPVDLWIDNGIIHIKLYEKESTKGVVRRIDDLGRICVPKEMRKWLGMTDGDPIDMYLDGQAICIRSVKLQCVCCESTDEGKLVEVKGVHMCPRCIEEFSEEVEKG